MRLTSILALTFCTVAVLPSCAPVAIRAGVGYAQYRMGGQVSLDSSSGGVSLGTVRNDLDDALDLGDGEGAVFVRVGVVWEKDRLEASGLGFSQNGSGVLANDFGDITAGTSVNTQLDFLNVRVAWSHDVLDIGLGGVGVRLAPGVVVDTILTGIDVGALGAFEEVETLVVLPMPLLQTEVTLGSWSALIDLAAMDLDLNDADGSYWDLSATLTWRPQESFEFLAGYRYLGMDTDGTADSRKFDADLDLRGWFIGAGVVF